MTGNKDSFTGTIITAALIFVLFVFDGFWIPVIISAFLVLAAVLISLKENGDFNGLFDATFPMTLVTSVVVLLQMYGVTAGEFSSFTGAVIAGATWLLPTVFSGIYALTAGNGERCGFNNFFKANSMLLALVYTAFLIFWYFRFNETYVHGGVVMQLVPFGTFSGYIEAIIRGTITVSLLVFYFLYNMVVFIPVGFLIGLFLQKFPFWTKIILFVCLMVFLETLRYMLGLNNLDIDNIIFGFVGLSLGYLSYSASESFFIGITGNGLTGRRKRGIYL